ncbi:MAG: exodeoxyribonuclease VII small subunit [Clostridiales bacterium]|nr:exodeoxyribonuclease VII small subunit [Clostridiales bacterium]
MELETKLKALEETADKLDDKELALDEAIRLFEQGVELIRSCMDSLQESKGKIEVIRGELNEMLARDRGEEN